MNYNPYDNFKYVEPAEIRAQANCFSPGSIKHDYSVMTLA